MIKKMKSSFEIWAHRGLHKKFPENSLEAVQAALDAGIYKIELDVWLHNDELVLSHDEPSGEHSSLADALKIVDGRAEMYLELKHEPSAKKSVSLINRTYEKHVGTIVFASFDVEALRVVKKASPSARLALNYRGIDNDFIDLAEELGAEYLGMNWKRALPNYFNIRQAKDELDVKLLAYTVNLPCIKRFVKLLGFSGIFTDKPSRF
jgi:glycerophosphoryl diester phosphodiesterase